jgi:hypothetical protein
VAHDGLQLRPGREARPRVVLLQHRYPDFGEERPLLVGEPQRPRRISSSRLMVALRLPLARRFSMYAFRSFGLSATARHVPKWALSGLR